MSVCFVLFYFFISSRTQIAAIASRSLERSKEFAKKHGIPKVYGGYEALAKDPDVGEWRAVSSGQAGKTLYSCCFLRLIVEHLYPDRHCVRGSAAHRALASRPAVPRGRQECAVREALRYELQTSEGARRRGQEEQRLPDGGEVEQPEPLYVNVTAGRVTSYRQAAPTHCETERFRSII